MSARVMHLVALLIGLCASACQFDSVRFYNVIRTPLDECDILPEGEFCVEQEQLSAPVTEVWTVERRGEEILVYVDEEVWVAVNPDAETDANLLQADKLEVATRDPGPCTNTVTRSIDAVATADDLSGLLRSTSRLTGPEDCGDTPRGLRAVYSIAGLVAGAP